MPDKSFALERGGTERLAVSWQGAFKDLSVSFDGRPVATFDDPKELKRARRIALPDGSSLDVQVASPFLFPELLLTRDGEPVPGSSGDPAMRHAAAWHVVAAVGVLNVLIGLLVEATDADFLRAIGAGWPSVGAGIVYGVLAWFVRGRSLAALAIAVALFVLDGVFLVASAAQRGGTPPVGGIVARALFLVPMIRGFPAIRDLARPRRRRVPPRTPGRTARPPSGSATAAAAGVGPAPGARVLSGDAERRRLQLTERLSTAPAPTVLGRGPLSIKGKASVDAAAAALRFVAHKCEVGEAGLRVTTREGHIREVAWGGLGRIVARQLPPDPPWDAGLLLDLVAWLEDRWEPIRVFTTTIVKFAALDGAPGPRTDTLRRLVRHVRERHPAVAVDDETLAFAEGRPPARFVSMSQLAEYDAVYGPGTPA